MTKAAAAIQCGYGRQEPSVRQPPPTRSSRPGWVLKLVVAVLADADQPLRPQDVIHRAERVHGHRIAASSIRNCLREAALRNDGPIERLGHGRYGLRR